MSNPENEKLVQYLVALSKQGRKISYPDDSRWGALIEPAPGEISQKNGKELRVALFVSWEFGYVAFETMKSFEYHFPGTINIVGFVTDNPANPDAKISVKKRIWGLVDLPERVVDETVLLESAVSHGIPAYTGEIKTDSFRTILRKWNPDVILVCVFGQVIDSFIIDYPACGIYNFHPSDLAHGHGAGTSPYTDLAERKATSGNWCVHQVSLQVDSGPIVGQSPPIYLADASGNIPGHPLVVYNRLAEGLADMVFLLSWEVLKKFQRGEKSPVTSIDFPTYFPTSVKDKLMKPIEIDQPVNLFLGPDLRPFL